MKVLVIDMITLESYEGSAQDLYNEIMYAQDDIFAIQNAKSAIREPGAEVYILGIGVGREKPKKGTA